MALGHVTTNEVKRSLGIDPLFFELNAESFDKMAIDIGINKNDVGWFIVEYTFCIYDLPKYDLAFVKKLPIVKS